MQHETSINFERVESEQDDGFGYRAQFGVIVLATDQTVEIDLASMQQSGLAWHFARIEMATVTTPSSLTDMHSKLRTTAALLPREFEFDAIGYACTSASTLIGDDKVAAQIHQEHPGVPCTNPILAGITGLTRLQVARIALLTPYTQDVTQSMAQHFQRHGIAVNRVGSFNEPSELRVPKISTQSIAKAALALGSDPNCDAVFIACTSLRTFSVIRDLEKQLGKPVVSSNQALAWHMLRLAGIDDESLGPGALFSRRL